MGQRIGMLTYTMIHGACLALQRLGSEVLNPCATLGIILEESRRDMDFIPHTVTSYDSAHWPTFYEHQLTPKGSKARGCVFFSLSFVLCSINPFPPR